jgi:hypothetical protein
MDLADAAHEALAREWTDQYVEIDPGQPELLRFKGIVGRVVTINWNNRAIVDFMDGGWYDISPAYLKKLDKEAGVKYKNTNSAQVIPEKQG